MILNGKASHQRRWLSAPVSIVVFRAELGVAVLCAIPVKGLTKINPSRLSKNIVVCYPSK